MASLDEYITENPSITHDDILKKARHIQLGLDITSDYKYAILMCGIFNPKRTMINHWKKYQPLFTKLIAQDGSGSGQKRVLQATIFMHMHKYPEMKS